MKSSADRLTGRPGMFWGLQGYCYEEGKFACPPPVLERITQFQHTLNALLEVQSIL